MIDAFSQLSSVSAVLGGFALAFLGVVVSVSERSLSREITAALSLVCSGALVLCALGWSLSAVWLASPMAESNPDMLMDIHATLSPLFLVGTCLFFWTLGASGWIYSRRLGMVSTLIGVLATIGGYLVVTPFLISP
ncbi:hypothetical protein [Dokdonella sp.]|uniref:hypothetical protein n=1 Tax=Dokdonella sp. TaxID=2291710 RepID=UPI003527D395